MRRRPRAPGTLTAAGAVGRATLSWGAATDNVGVVRYNVHRGTTPGFTPSAGEPDRAADRAGLHRYHRRRHVLLRVTAEDAAGNVGPASNEASATVTTDTTAPSAPTGLARTVDGQHGQPELDGVVRDVGVARYNVHRGTSARLHPDAGNRIAQPTADAYADTGLGTGTYYYMVTAEDAAGNVSAASTEISATVADATPPTAPRRSPRASRARR